MFKRLSLLLVVAGLLLCLGGCGLIDQMFLPPPTDTALELYEAGQDAMKEKKYAEAAEMFTALKDRYPFSPYTQKAELSLGDALFMAERYEGAAEAYKEFEALHPRSEEIPYVLYQIGLADFRQFESVDRPLQRVNEALEYFYRLRETYPGTKYAEEAEGLIRQCRRVLAEHELFVADFYWRSERYGAAYDRYQYVVTNYSDLGEVSGYARQMADLAYFEFQKSDSEEQRRQEEGNWRHWFNWL